MSGGIDSSVSAALLNDQGFEVAGCVMQVWDYSKSAAEQSYGTCCSSLDVQDAREVCRILNIPFYVLNCEKPFREKVIDPFIQAYTEGETPVPCTNCNTFLKFDYLAQKMKELECDFLATGHYAQVKPLKGKGHAVFLSQDEMKDQTWFLFTLPKALLPKLLFPVGGMTKAEVRAAAEAKGLPVTRKRESAGICFIGSEGYKKFVENRLSAARRKPGFLKLFPSGEPLGRHEGVHRFTVGQRRGLGIASSPFASRPLYVIRIDGSSGDVWLGEESDLYSKEMELKGLHLLDDLKDGEKLNVRPRFHHKGALAEVFYLPPAKTARAVRVRFEQPQKALAPGQAAVFYRGRQLVGGGFIAKNQPD